jgi:transposase
VGRSRGGFSTKIHLKVDFDGLPLAFHLTEGQAGDSPQFEVLLDLGPDITPRAAVGDKGYDSRRNRTGARERGICPAIPYKANAKNRPNFFPKALYRGRARIEQSSCGVVTCRFNGREADALLGADSLGLVEQVGSFIH